MNKQADQVEVFLEMSASGEVFLGPGPGPGLGPGSRGAVIKADSAVIFTAHCITALLAFRALHTCREKTFGLGDCAAGRSGKGAQSLKQEGCPALPELRLQCSGQPGHLYLSRFYWREALTFV